MHQHTYDGKNKIIHSSAQTDYCKNAVDDRSIKVDGSQHMTTLDNSKKTCQLGMICLSYLFVLALTMNEKIYLTPCSLQIKTRI